MVTSGTEPHPWTRGGIRMPRSVLTLIETAARAAYARDEEACGYVSGPAEDPLLADQVVELENLANRYHQADPEGHPRTGREYFKINALKFERSVSDGQKSGRPVKVFFHSHLDCGAYFSQEDAASMTLGGSGKPSYPLSYLVTAVDQGAISAHKLFIYDEDAGAFVEAPFSIEDQ